MCAVGREDGKAGWEYMLPVGLSSPKAASTLRQYFRSHCFDMVFSVYVDSVAEDKRTNLK